MMIDTAPLRWMRNPRLALACLGLVAWFLLVGSGTAMAGLAERRTPVVLAIQKVQPSVVSITSEKKAASTSRWPFSAEEAQRPRVSGMGTGVILDERGFILTNQHVVDRVQGIEVHLSDGSAYPAQVIEQDASTDLAILKINAGRPLQAISLGSSADLMIGETVITIGNAFGYENTTSSGVISALGRNVTLSDEQVYRNLIQTDACINPGNSGGPLVNIDGELIGINVAVRAGAQGIGFALPIDDVKRIATDLMSTRRLASTWHGIAASEVFRGEQRTVVINDIQAQGPAEAAGLRRGDEVLRVGELSVTSPLDIERALLDVRAGQQATVVVRRGGEELSLPIVPQAVGRTVITASAPGAGAPPAAAASSPDPAIEQVWKLLGLRTVPVPRDYVKVVSPSFRGGLFVEAVLPNSPASRASIQKGDILVGMNVGDRDLETIRPDNLLYILKQSRETRAEALPFYLIRRNEFVQGLLSLGNQAETVRR